jgi:hypothetical protein
MASRVADEREQRRGLVLGLTLAEVLLLLLFLLMLALASQMQEWKDKASEAIAALEELRPLQEQPLANGATDVTGVEELAARFQRLQDVERENAALKAQAESLSAQSELSKSLGVDKVKNARDLAAVVQHAAQYDPSDPPAFLKRAIEVLDRLGVDTQPDQVKPLSQMIADSELDQKLATAQAERDKYRLDALNLMHRNGNGLTYPSCWKTPSGQTEYIFDVTFGDRGVIVKDATLGRAHDNAWQMVGSFPRNTEIDEHTFIAATKKLANWATSQNCKFYTINRDETGSSNKVRYKLLQRTIEQNFYPFYAVSSAASLRSRGSANPEALGRAPDQSREHTLAE